MRSPRTPDPPSTSTPSWREHVAAWRKSGLTAEAYGAPHGLTAKTLYNWARRARIAPGRATARRPPPTPRLLPISIEAPALCEVVLPDGTLLRFPAHLNPADLTAFLRGIEAR